MHKRLPLQNLTLTSDHHTFEHAHAHAYTQMNTKLIILRNRWKGCWFLLYIFFPLFLNYGLFSYSDISYFLLHLSCSLLLKCPSCLSLPVSGAQGHLSTIFSNNLNQLSLWPSILQVNCIYHWKWPRPHPLKSSLLPQPQSSLDSNNSWGYSHSYQGT